MMLKADRLGAMNRYRLIAPFWVFRRKIYEKSRHFNGERQ